MTIALVGRIRATVRREIAACLSQRKDAILKSASAIEHESHPMSFFSALFGRGGSAAAAKASEPVEYKGYVIVAAPYKNNGHYQTAGTIAREVDGVKKEHHFIRADAYVTYEDAVTFTLSKARQIIDLQGDRIFNETRGVPSG
jgi:hypothetical protein